MSDATRRGTIFVRDGQVTATNADGTELGTFKTDRAAMAAIVAAAKVARPTPIAAYRWMELEARVDTAVPNAILDSDETAP